jgi:hypothetical protein
MQKIDGNKAAWMKPVIESLGNVRDVTATQITKPKAPSGTVDDFGFPRSV